MKKKNFVTLIMSVTGGILFALGMCMGLLPQWNAFKQGVVFGVTGAVILLAMIFVRRKMDGKPMLVLNGRTIGTTLLGIFGVLVLGVGMCMVMVGDMLVWGIVVGIAGIVLLLCLFPVIRGLE